MITIVNPFMFRNTEYTARLKGGQDMQKGHEAPMKKEYKKPKVTVTKLQIEERLMACAKLPADKPCKNSKRQS
jgi:hypothetical protein